jgi:short-subunit dehydrogenase
MQPSQMTVVITGACGGIGQMISRQLAASGASLYLCDRAAKGLSSLQQELTEQAVGAQFIEATAVDLTDDQQVGRWLESFDPERPPNVLVNNAGICRFEIFDRLDDESIEQIMVLNSIVPMKLARKLLPVLRQQNEARIVNIGSTFGAIGFPGYSVYSASKFAIRGFSQALARELSDSNISVGCILPRATHTAINTDRVVELNRKLNVTMDSPETVATAVVRFISTKQGELALGWPEKLLVRINSVFPNLIGHAISKKLPLIKQFAA